MFVMVFLLGICLIGIGAFGVIEVLFDFQFNGPGYVGIFVVGIGAFVLGYVKEAAKNRQQHLNSEAALQQSLEQLSADLAGVLMEAQMLSTRAARDDTGSTKIMN